MGDALTTVLTWAIYALGVGVIMVILGVAVMILVAIYQVIQEDRKKTRKSPKTGFRGPLYLKKKR